MQSEHCFQLSLDYRCKDLYLGNRKVYISRFPKLETLAWKDAASYCKTHWNGTGQLIRLRSPQEHLKLHELLGATTYWIGATDSHQENQWQWIDGCSVEPSILQWGNGQPNNFISNQHCLSYSLAYELNDAICTEKFTFACELPPTGMVCGKCDKIEYTHFRIPS